ncbi:stage V sporulation protein S [Collinsella tanakaei]|uniref:stage V sporulation protein S n=1 Tax=Collinsella tanakaei TaxID=626935 RepID=UPI0025A4CBC1|nr:stage V sporulation protein S [Collinsella tanakaei]MDM8299803.1 stage V sporulation protein S [Collinsella tanakaei]
MEFLKVSSKSSPASVAGAIAGMVKDGVPVNLQCVGAGAVNQAIKAIAIARGFLIPTGFDISCAPVFSDILINGESRTAIRLAIYVHSLSSHAGGAFDFDRMDDSLRVG